MKLTFRFTLMGTLVSLIGISVAVVGLSSYFNARFIAEQLSEQMLDQTASRISQRVNNLTRTAATLSRINRSLLRSRQLPTDDFRTLCRHLMTTLREYPELSYLSFGKEATGD